MHSTKTDAPDRLAAAAPTVYRRNDEEYEIPPRWLWSRLHEEPVPTKLECEFFREVH